MYCARAAVYIATDIRFHNYFHLSNLLAMVIYKKRPIVHIQCLPRVDGSIVAGVLLVLEVLLCSW